jgi:hypothetical protein
MINGRSKEPSCGRSQITEMLWLTLNVSAEAFRTVNLEAIILTASFKKHASRMTKLGEEIQRSLLPYSACIRSSFSTLCLVVYLLSASPAIEDRLDVLFPCRCFTR